MTQYRTFIGEYRTAPENDPFEGITQSHDLIWQTLGSRLL